MSLITFRDRNTKGGPSGPVWYLQFDALTIEEFTREADVTQYPVETGAILSDHYQPQPRQISLLGVVSDTPSSIWTMIEGKQNAAPPYTMSATPPLLLDTRKQHENLAMAAGQTVSRLGPAGVPNPVVTGILPSQRLVRGNIERARMYIPSTASVLQVAPGTGNAGTGETRVTIFRQVIDALMEKRNPVEIVIQDGSEFKNMFITSARAPRVSGRGGSVTFALDLQEVIFATSTVTKEPQPAAPAEPKNETKKARGRRNPKPTKAEEMARFLKDVSANIEAFGQ